MTNERFLDSSIRDSFEFWDFYALTQSGVIRRVSLPEATYPMVLYMVMCRNGAKEEALDQLACVEADRKPCGYAEAWVAMVHGFDDHLGERFAETFASEELARKLTTEFLVQQGEREKRWRTERNDWRESLPPALD